MKNKYFWVGSIIGFVVIFDQVTKYFVEKQVRLYEVIRVIPGFFNITHVRNKGAAFSLFSGAPETFRSMFFITVTIAAIVVIAALLRKTREPLLIGSFSLVAGRAVGHLIYRVR